MNGKYFLEGSILEKCGQKWKNVRTAAARLGKFNPAVAPRVMVWYFPNLAIATQKKTWLFSRFFRFFCQNRSLPHKGIQYRVCQIKGNERQNKLSLFDIYSTSWGNLGKSWGKYRILEGKSMWTGVKGLHGLLYRWRYRWRSSCSLDQRVYL